MTLNDAIAKVAGEHFKSLENEFVDFNNDLRVATVREVMDLGIPRETAETVLYVAKEAYCGKDIATILAEA